MNSLDRHYKHEGRKHSRHEHIYYSVVLCVIVACVIVVAHVEIKGQGLLFDFAGEVSLTW